jgi:hypothetical protein
MNKRFAFLLTLLILVPVILAACGGDDDEGDEVTSDSVTNAFEELLAGNTEPAKAISCEEDAASLDAAAEGMAALTGEEGADTSVSCSVDGDAGSCDLTITVEIEGADPIEQMQTMNFAIVDGKICGGMNPG